MTGDSQMEGEDFKVVQGRKKRSRTLGDSDSDSSTKTVKSGPPTTTTPAIGRIPPIIIAPQAVSATWPVFIRGIRDETSEFEAKFKGDRLHLSARTVESFRAIQRYLTKKGIGYHTFSLQEDAELKVTIRGIHHTTDLQVLSAELQSHGLEPTLVVALPRRTDGGRCPTNSFLVKFRKIGQWEKVWKLTHLLGVQVSVDPFEPRAGVPQCYRCQGFGHSSVNCNLPPRCVRCAGDHEVRNCVLPHGSGIKCCNCDAAHPASYRGCKAYKDAVAAKKRRDAESAAHTSGRKQPTKKPAAPQKVIPPPGTSRGSFAAIAARGSSKTPATPGAQPSLMPPPPPPPATPTTSREQPASRPARPTTTHRKRRNKPGNKSVGPNVVPGSEIDGDVSDSETDSTLTKRPRRPRPAPRAHPNDRLPPASRRDHPARREPPTATPTPTFPADRNSILIRDLVLWITRMIPVIVTAKDKPASELVAELMSGLLDLLNGS